MGTILSDRIEREDPKKITACELLLSVKYDSEKKITLDNYERRCLELRKAS